MSVPEDPERALALSYAPSSARAGIAALLALDDALGKLLRSAREPALAQIRLAWWRDRLAELDEGPPPAEPVLQGIAAHVLPAGVTGAALSAMAEAWDLLFDAEIDADTLARFGAGRGGRLFEAGGVLLGADAADPLAAAGEGWALADLSAHLSDPPAAAAAKALALARLDAALGVRWSRAGRALGALAHLARLDLRLGEGAPRPVGSPRRVGRLLWHRLTGR